MVAAMVDLAFSAGLPDRILGHGPIWGRLLRHEEKGKKDVQKYQPVVHKTP